MKKSLYMLGNVAVLSLLAACGGQNGDHAASGTVSSEAASAMPASGAKGDIEAREQLMKSFKKDMGTMGKMVKGDEAFDPAVFQQAADSLDTNAGKPWAHYTEESSREESGANPDIWSKPDEFKKEIEKFTAATAALKTAAASGKLDDVKKPFGGVGQSCKSCHDSFRMTE